MKAGWAELVTGTLAMYAQSAREATLGLKRNWIVPFAAVVLFIAYYFAAMLLSPLGMAGGMVISLLGLAALALYYGWIAETNARQRIRKEDLLHFDVGLFFALISVAFILFLAEFFLNALATGSGAQWIMMFFSLAVVFLCNALPEVVYLRRSESLYAIQESFRFTIDNWIEWYLPFLVITAPFWLVAPAYYPLLLASLNPFLPVSIIFQLPQQILPAGAGLIASIAGVILAHWFMLFRAQLFQELSSGSRRQRAFLARQR